MIIGLFGDKECDEFARGLATQIEKRVPPAKLRESPGKKGDAALAKTLQHVFLAAQEYQRTHKVGLLKQLRLSKTFQEELNALGYEDAFIKEATLTLVKAMRGNPAG